MSRKRIVDRFGRPLPTQIETHMIDLQDKLLNQLKSGGTSNAFRGWLTDNNDANTDNDSLPDVRSRCGDLYNNSAIGRACITRPTIHVVGSGLRLEAQIDHEVLGLTIEQANVINKDLQRRFHNWAKENDCTISRKYNFYHSQILAFKSSITFGDAFALLLSKKYPRVDNDLKIRLIEAQQCSSPHDMDTFDGKIIGGVEVDKAGAVAAYHFQKAHPGSKVPNFSWRRIPAFGQESGRRNVLHIADFDRISQRRAVPMLSPVVEEIKQISRYTEYEIMAAVINASLTVFINQDMPTTTGIPTAIGENEQVLDNATVDSAGELETDTKYEIGSGNVIEGEQGDKITPIDPKRPNLNFDTFIKSMAMQIGAAINQPADILLLMFSKSYTASRSALLEMWKFVVSRRSWLGNTYCQPVYEEWFTNEIIDGRILAPNFFETNHIRNAWLKSAWIGSGQQLLDPERETNAAIKRIMFALSNFEREFIKAEGEDWQASLEKLVNQMKQIESGGIELPKKNTKPKTGV